MHVHVNGESVELPDGATVHDLVTTLGLKGPVAVELNEQIVRHARHAEQQLHDGDRLEIVTLVGGG